jgi:hypothetical protein
VFAGVEADNTRAWPSKPLDADHSSETDAAKYDECLSCQ